MENRIDQIAEGFWNIRGSFKVAGVVDIGTQASLVRRPNGKFVLLDSYTFSEDVEREVRALTNGGADIEAILNVHPFHTVHVRYMHECFPDARLYGTARHHARFADLPWQSVRVEDPEARLEFGDEFDFQVPRGVDFISKNENVHFSSVLVLHRASRTIHVDDTLMFVRLPKVARRFGRSDLFSFHPTLAQALEKRAEAADEFADWATELADAWHDAENLCAAHTATLTAARNRGASIHDRILAALESVRPKLQAHRRKYS